MFFKLNFGRKNYRLYINIMQYNIQQYNIKICDNNKRNIGVKKYISIVEAHQKNSSVNISKIEIYPHARIKNNTNQQNKSV